MPRVPEVLVRNVLEGTTAADLRNLLGDEFRIVGLFYTACQLFPEAPMGFFFIRFRDMREAIRGLQQLDGRHGWVVRPNFDQSRCYRCGDRGHLPLECLSWLGCGWCGSAHHHVRQCHWLGYFLARRSSYNNRVRHD